MGSTTFVPIHDWAHMTVPTHVCAQTRLCLDTFVPRHIFAQTHFCPDMIVPNHVCAKTDTLVPRHELLWIDTVMSLVNNNIIIIVSTRLCVNLIDW